MRSNRKRLKNGTVAGQLLVKFPQALLAQTRRQAQADGINMSSWVRDAIKLKLAKSPKLDLIEPRPTPKKALKSNKAKDAIHAMLQQKTDVDMNAYLVKQAEQLPPSDTQKLFDFLKQIRPA